MTSNGTSIHTRLGIKRDAMTDDAVICPPIQSMVVVTSPIGDHAPPAFAAMMTSTMYFNRMGGSETNFLRSETITIVVVRLSRIADRKNVNTQTMMSSVDAFLVLSRAVMI